MCALNKPSKIVRRTRYPGFTDGGDRAAVGKMSLIFVYGTLRRGEVNHYLLKDAALLGAHRTRARYRMLHMGTYPGVVEGGPTAVVGEVYRVNSRQFADLDRLEDYPRLYTRKLISTAWGRAWIYLYRGPRQDLPVVSGGDWSAADKRRTLFSLY